MQKNKIMLAMLYTCSSLAIAEQSVTTLAPINVYSAYATTVTQDKTAASVTVLTEQDFAKRNATYVSDALKSVPGVVLSASGGRGTLSNIYLRGADANHTSVIIDGVKMNPVTGYGFDFGGLSLNNIDQIEVLRGEQSALWGSDAMGGVIYITTKSGLYKDKPFNVDVDFGLGTHGTKEAALTLSGYQDGFYYSLNGNSHSTQGISALSLEKFAYTAEDGKKITTGGAVEKDKFHRDNLALRLGYDNEDRGVELLASHSSQNVRFDNSLTKEVSVDDYIRTRESLFKLGGYFGDEQALFKHRASISHIKTDSDTFSAWASAYDAKKLNANYQLDINFDRDGDIQQALSLLSEYQQSKYHSSAYKHEESLVEKSIATEYRLFSEADHSLTLSGRYINSSEYQNALTGRIAGAYRLSPSIRAHASFGSAIQNPTMTEYYGWSGTFIGNPNLTPEKSLGGDVGLLLATTDKQHRLDITYFARNVDNFISSKVINNTTYATQAVNLDGTTKINGIEVAYDGTLTKDLSAYANYTYTRTKDSQRNQLVRRPPHVANIGLAHQLTSRLGTNINLAYVGERMDSYFDEKTYVSSRVKLPAYARLDFGVNYQLTQQLNIYAHLNNALNKKYEHTIGYGQYGRNVYVGLKGSF